MSIFRRSQLVTDDELAALLNRFEAGTSVDEKGTINFHRLDSDELERILPDAFDVDPAFTPRQIRYLLRQSLWACRKNGPLSIGALLEVATNIAKSELSRSPESYSLWTKFRARQMAFSDGFNIQWEGVSLEGSNDLPVNMSIEEFFFNGYGRVHPQEPAFYGYLIARCEARTEENAVARILDATDLFMALFNLYELWECSSRGTDRWAEGKLWNGPYHFVFRGETFLGNETIWFDPNFSEEAWNTFALNMQAVLLLIPEVQRALDALKNHPMRQVLIRSLRLMQNAMSSRDRSYSLLRYWSALEQLYGEPQAREKNYSRMIQRASFAERDKALTQWKLRHISRLRNEYVHTGDNSDELRTMSQWFRMLLSRHVDYILFHPDDAHSHHAWLAFVDLSADEAALKTQRDLIDRRIAFIERG